VECDRKEAGCRVPERHKEQQCDDGYRTRVWCSRQACPREPPRLQLSVVGKKADEIIMTVYS
jgi:hypothetical protein